MRATTTFNVSLRNGHIFVESMPLLLAKPLSFQPKYIIIAVFGIGLMVFFQSSSFSNDSNLFINIYHVILMFLYYSTWIFLIKYVNGSVYALPGFKELTPKQIFSFVLSGLMIVLLHFVISNALYYPIRNVILGRWPDPWKELIGVFPHAIISRMIDFGVIAAVLKIITINKLLNEKNLKLVSLESQLNQTQLAALKAQLNPHFLFNSLHAVSTLIGYDDDKARNMTVKISGLLRKMLEDQDKHTHSLGEELDYIKDYLEIEHERFHDRLEINLKIEEESLASEVPNLILQPLVENAFKHGISRSEGKGQINIEARMIDQAVEMKIANTSPETVGESSFGVGLENVRKRLYQLYGTTASLQIEQTNDTYLVELKIPQFT